MRSLIARITLVATLLLAGLTGAFAQCGTQAPANKFCGNDTGSQALATWKTVPAGALTPIAGGTVLGNPTGALAAPIATNAPVLGIPGTSTGQVGLAGATSGTAILRAQAVAGSAVSLLPTAAGTLVGTSVAPLAINATTGEMSIAGLAGAVLAGSPPAFTRSPVLGAAGVGGSLGFNGGTSGSVVIAPQAVAGTPTLTLPNTSGTFAVGATAPLALSATTGNLSITGLAGGVLAGAGPAFTITPVLGAPGASLGTLGFAGNTSGTATIRAQATAGSPTITLANASGTTAVNATGPIALDAATGMLTCPTCVTSSGGGAITGTAPVAVSAAGVVSITGLAGGVLAGAGPAFTRNPVLGAAGSVVGDLGFQNATSGTVTIRPVTGALGTPIILMPAASGTMAVSATAPITLSAAGAIGITGTALTKTDDTNVTITLGGTPASALVAAASLTMGWNGQLAVGRGGTGLSAGTSGGIPYFNSTSTMLSSGALGANQIMLGGGAGASPTTFACGTATTVVHGGTPPTCSQVAIGADVSGLGSGVGTALGIAANGAGGFPTYTAGTWTPTFAGSTVAGTGQTYAIQVGSYEIIGRQVTVRFNLTATSLGTATGNLTMTGLPFATANVTSDNGLCWVSIYGVVGLAANNFSVTGFIPPNTSTITFLSNNNTSTANITIAQAGNAVTMNGACVYRNT